MSKLRIFVTCVFALALGFGVWTIAAVSFQNVSSSFSDGDTVSASEFNDLFARIDSNFSDAATQINTNESDIGDLQANKVAKAGDSMSGILDIDADGGDYDPLGSGIGGALQVRTTNSSGVAAFVEADSSEPALFVKNSGSGPIMRAYNANTLQGLEVANDGSVLIGQQSDPAVTISAAGDGSVTNSVGAGLPVAWAAVAAAGSYSQKTDNVSGTSTGGDSSSGEYVIEFTGVDISGSPVVTVTSFDATGGEIVTYAPDATNDRITVRVTDDAGAGTSSAFSFVLHAP